MQWVAFYPHYLKTHKKTFSLAMQISFAPALQHNFDKKFILFSVSGLKEEKLIKKQTSRKLKHVCKLYSRVF